MSINSPGTLYLIPVLLGSTEVTEVIPERTIETTGRIKYFIAENSKSARQYLKLLPTSLSMQEIEVMEMDKHASYIDFDIFFRHLRSGNDTGLLSEAGMPAVADPGSAYVMQAHKEGICVVPLSGPSSLIMALAASGLNGQSFAFNGYLPREKDERIIKIRQLEKQAEKFRQTQIFIETPYRNQALLNDLLQTCDPSRLLCVATDISLSSESIRTYTIGHWRKKTVDLNKRPSVFLLL